MAWLGGLGIATSFLVTTALIVALAPFARRIGLVDYPGGRKAHGAPTPTVGGLAMALGATVGMLVAAWASGMVPGTQRLMGLGFGCAILLLDGLADDLWDLRWYVRVLNQVLAALAVVYVAGLSVENLGTVFGFETHRLGSLSVPVTVICTVGLINAVNMVDGIDGLAGSLVLAALIMLAFAAGYAGNMNLVGGLMVLSGAVAAFLLFNMRWPWQARARVFMGDAGSAPLGLVIAWAAFRVTQNPESPVSPVLAPFFLALPVIDCLILILRRIKAGRSPFDADRNHLHHLMLEAGFTSSQTVVILTGLSLAIGGTAALAYKADVPEPLLTAAFLSMLLGAFWLTAKRERAIGAFRALRRSLRLEPARARPLPAAE